MEVGSGDKVCDHVATDDDDKCMTVSVKIHKEDGVE